MMNGIALHGGFIPYGGTFLVFSDYARNALRMAALMQIRVIYVFTHDSIGLGEDGPTHQPVEHAATPAPHPQHGRLAALRHRGNRGGLGRGAAAHGRPDRAAAVAAEPAVRASASRWPTCSRAATCCPTPPWPRAVIIATGSEVQLALGAAEAARRRGHRRCAWSPCLRPPSSTARPRRTGNSVLPPGVPRVAVEAGVTDFWRKYVGLEGAVVGIDRFGESAPAGDLFKHFGFTAENVAAAVRKVFGEVSIV